MTEVRVVNQEGSKELPGERQVKVKMRVRKPSKAEQITACTVRDHNHLHSEDIASRLSTKISAIVEAEELIIETTSVLKQLRARLQEDNAVATGLQQIMEARR